MNSLSWTIYFIQIIDSFDTFMSAVAVFLFITAAIAFAARVLSSTERDWEPIHPSLSRYWKFGVIAGFVSAFIGVLVPDRNTMLLIAASQIGERVVASTTVQNVVDPSIDLLKVWIEEQTRALRRGNESPRNGR